MPLVVVNRGLGMGSDQFMKFIDKLPELVARSLTCDNPDGKLTAADVEVWSRSAERLAFEKGSEKLQIVVFANDYPERRANIDSRREKLAHDIRALLPVNIHGWVWIRLAPGSFEEF